MIPPAIRRKYNNNLPSIETVAKRVRETVLVYCEDNGFAYTGRVKSIQSVAEKLETGRFASWSAIDDLFACTIVIPTLDHEARVLEFLRARFVEVVTKQRGSTKKAPEVFRFDATRFVGRLVVPEELPPEADLGSICFEVQIRSAFEHAWSVTTHALTYKASRIDWRLLRLTAQLKASVEQLDALVLAFESSAEQIVEHNWPELNAKQTLLEGFATWFKAGRLPEELEPSDMSRFAENVYGLVSSSKGFHRRKAQKSVERVLSEVDTFLMQHGSSAVPMSISLFQFVLGVLTDSKSLSLPLERFHALITPEVIEFHPGTSAISPVVDLDS